MRAPASIVALVLLAGLASADTKTSGDPKDPKPQKIDPNPKKLDATVMRDSAGGTYVVIGTSGDTTDRKVFYGTGKTLYQQRNTSASRDGDSWSVFVWTPRLTEFRDGYIEKKKDGTFFKSCWGGDDAVLTEVLGEKAAEVMSKYAFMTPLHVRKAHLLARDNSGIYYYVDILRDGGGERLFIGRKGGLKQVPIIDSATDSAGRLFITRIGSLKAEYAWVPNRVDPSQDKQQTKVVWLKGERRKELDWIDFADSKDGPTLVYSQLGLYGALGTICDNL